MTDAPTPLRDAAFMQALLDLVIPPSSDGSMPGAGGLDVASGLADRIEADAAVGPLVQAGLLAVQQAAMALDPAGLAALGADARRDVVEAQAAAHPMLMLGLGLLLYPAYYQHPRVLEGLGEPPRPPFPEGYDLEESDAELMERLRLRRRA